MRPNLYALIVTGCLTLTLQACGDEKLSNDPEVAEREVDEKVSERADTLEEAAAKAVAIREAEIDITTQEIIDETRGPESTEPAE